MKCKDCSTPLKKCLKCGTVYCSKCDTHGSGHDWIGWHEDRSVWIVQKKVTILAALRYFQKNYQDGIAFGMSNNFFDEEEPLTENDIDELCEEVNCD